MRKWKMSVAGEVSGADIERSSYPAKAREKVNAHLRQSRTGRAETSSVIFRTEWCYRLAGAVTDTGECISAVVTRVPPAPQR